MASPTQWMFGWTLGVGDGQGGLACCGSWGHKESDMTERQNTTNTKTSPMRTPPQGTASFLGASLRL